MAANRLTDLIDAYQKLRERKDALEAELKEVNSDLRNSEDELSEYMAKIEIDKVSMRGYTYKLQEKLEISKIAGTEDELFEQLRTDGLGDLIHLDVNAQRLNAALRELAEQNGGDLPHEYDNCVRQYRHYDISRRKSG